MNGLSPPNALPLTMTVGEVARELRIGESTAYRYLSDGTIPGVVKIGGAVRVHRAAFVEWMAKRAGLVAVDMSGWRQIAANPENDANPDPNRRETPRVANVGAGSRRSRGSRGE